MVRDSQIVVLLEFRARLGNHALAHAAQVRDVLLTLLGTIDQTQSAAVGLVEEASTVDHVLDLWTVLVGQQPFHGFQTQAHTVRYRGAAQ